MQARSSPGRWQRRLAVVIFVIGLVLILRLSARVAGEVVLQTPAEPTTATATATVAVASATAVPRNPTTAALAAPLPAPTVVPLEMVRKQYRVLLLLEASSVTMQELAARDAVAALSDPQTTALLHDIEQTLDTTARELFATLPAPALAATWAEAQRVTPLVEDLLWQWMDGEIASTEVAGRLAPLQQRLDQLMIAAAADLAVAYGGDAGEWRQERERAIAAARARIGEQGTDDTTVRP